MTVTFFANFNVVFQPHIIANDKRMTIAHTGYITRDEHGRDGVMGCPVSFRGGF